MTQKDPRYPIAQDVSLLPVFRQVHVCNQLIERLMTKLFDDVGLTTSQFDVLSTLGDTAGLTFKEVSQQSLVTGGTLTPVISRLEAKGLVHRCKGEADGRQTILSLTAEGQALYEQVFLPTVDAAKAKLDALTDAEQAQLVALLKKLRDALEA